MSPSFFCILGILISPSSTNFSTVFFNSELGIPQHVLFKISVALKCILPTPFSIFICYYMLKLTKVQPKFEKSSKFIEHLLNMLENCILLNNCYEVNWKKNYISQARGVIYYIAILHQKGSEYSDLLKTLISSLCFCQ